MASAAAAMSAMCTSEIRSDFVHPSCSCLTRIKQKEGNLAGHSWAHVAWNSAFGPAAPLKTFLLT